MLPDMDSTIMAEEIPDTRQSTQELSAKPTITRTAILQLRTKNVHSTIQFLSSVSCVICGFSKPIYKIVFWKRYDAEKEVSALIETQQHKEVLSNEYL
jgi:hypothetical protein